MNANDNELEIGTIKSIEKKTRIYTTLISLFPVLSMYSSGFPGINLGEILLIVFLVFSTLLNKKVENTNNSANVLIIFAWYVIVSSLISILVVDSSQFSNVLPRIIRFLFYLFVIFYSSRKFFSIEYASKFIKYISVLATIYILIQNIGYRAFGIILKGFLPMVPLYTSQYETFDYASMYDMLFYRPTSFFLEPAHYSQYVLIGLVTFLFKGELYKKNISLAIFLTIGVLLSTSGQGLIIACFVWLVFICNLIFGKRKIGKKRILGLFFLMIFVISAPVIISSNIVQDNLSRFMATGSNTALTARTEGYVAYLKVDNIYIKIFGAGFGNTPFGYWFSGVSYILYCLGFFGLIFLVGIFAKYYIGAKNNNYTKMVVLVSFILSVSAEIINSYWIVFIFSLICYSNNVITSKKGIYSSESIHPLFKGVNK